MVVIWLLFTLMLFVAEPLFFHRWLLARAETRPEIDLRADRAAALDLVGLSLITLFGAVLGSHGALFIG